MSPWALTYNLTQGVDSITQNEQRDIDIIIGIFRNKTGQERERIIQGVLHLSKKEFNILDNEVEIKLPYVKLGVIPPMPESYLKSKTLK